MSVSDYFSETVTYAKWKPRALKNRVWYYEITNTTPTSYIATFGKLGYLMTTILTSNSDVTDFEADIKPTANSAATDVELFELAKADAAIGKLDGRQQKAYEVSASVMYVGYAEVGTALSDTGWTIRKLELDADGNPTSEKWTAVGAATWNNRSSETYE